MVFPDFQAEQDYAYELIKKRFSIEFSKPEFKVISSDEFMSEFSKPKSMKQMFDPIPDMFIDNKGLMVIYDHKQPSKKHERQYCFIHELGHCLETELNPELSLDKVFLKMDYDGKEREKGVVLFAFLEGIAERIAVESSLVSNSSELKMFAQSKGENRLSSINEYIEDELDLLARVYNKGIKNKEEVLVKFARKNKGLTVEVSAHNFGYYFAAQHKDLDVKKMIMNPPHTYEEFFMPEKYREQVK